MVDSKKRKGSISEEDMAVVLQRYSAKTILGLLQEIAQFKFNDAKIDWSEIANKQSIGITCPRECQMLWRHLAYRDPLLEKLEEDATPLDDDSDLEFVMEPSPTISAEVSTEAFAYVKKWIHMKTKNTGAAMNYRKTSFSEDQLNMRQALSMALDSPSNRSSPVPCSGGTSSSTISSSIFSNAIPESASFNMQKVPNQSQQTLSQAIPQKIGSSLLNKPRAAQVRAPITITSRTGSNTMIQKAAIAAGGRIAPAETAASLFKAVQSKNVVHIRPGGTVSVSATATKPSPSTLAVGPHPSVASQTLSSPPVSSGNVSCVSGAGSQITKFCTAKPAVQPASQHFSTLLQHPCKQPQEKSKQTVCVSSNPLGTIDGTVCSLLKGGSVAPKTGGSALAANQGQLSVVDLETDEVDKFADDVDKCHGTMKETQKSCEMTGNAFKSSSPVSEHDKALHTETCEMQQISLQNLSPCTGSQEDMRSKHSEAVDSHPSPDGEGKTIGILEKNPNEGLSQSSSTQDSVDGEDKNINKPTSCVSSSIEVETFEVPVIEGERSTENGNGDICLGNATVESVTTAGRANDGQRKDGMICTASTNLPGAF